jgi:hypothetical protein
MSAPDIYTRIRVLSAAAADVDRDGKKDSVLVFGYDLNSVSRIEVRFGNGDGTLRTPVTTPLQRDPWRVLLRDLTGDGIPDVLFDEVGHVIMREGKSDGTYGPLINYGGTLTADWVAAGDFDGDGDADLVLTTNGSAIAWNDGSGKFSTPVSITVGHGLLFAGDLNGDGLDDLVVANRLGSGVVRYYLNRGNATFEQRPTLETSLGDVNQITIRDFNGDGFADVLVTERASTDANGRLALFLGDGAGGLPRVVEMDATTYGTVVGDFNGDGAPDLLDGGFVRLNECANTRRRAVGR